jgi:hypothetical protein
VPLRWIAHNGAHVPNSSAGHHQEQAQLHVLKSDIVTHLGQPAQRGVKERFTRAPGGLEHSSGVTTADGRTTTRRLDVPLEQRYNKRRQIEVDVREPRALIRPWAP